MPQQSDSVFINCPFDAQYMPLFRALVFTVLPKRFFPEMCNGRDDGLDNGLSKILRIISECKYGIHDISRTQLNNAGFPRFNMPFELAYFTPVSISVQVKTQKIAAIFEHTKYSYQQTISDLNGIDAKDHGGDYKVLIRKTSSWLTTSSRRRTIPGHLLIIADFDKFEIDLPQILITAGLSLENLSFNDLSAIIEEWIAQTEF